ncbi:putative quinol monooxygenase [Gordonia polyisoprenivorans]|uniref:putative quinol monooxygenase n=1 Tax=Gordonia polyisoprenivorans TaxID=84595 RepID=UPI001AD7BCD3|nr:putative quinol monooxygenase [Gordonia polyisoprenivorans]QTI68930.1 antibiotic biosynthesis monooxygenase [Gordonia polyisoprenivorans]
MLSLIVSVQVKPEMRAEFLPAIAENALRSVTDEPGCLRFDVAEAVEEPNRYFFYEIYTGADAFADHKAAPHFAAWRAVAERCLVPGSQVNTFAELQVTESVAA